MRRVLIAENQVVQQTVHVWIEQTGVVRGGTELFRIVRSNGPSGQLFDLAREVFEESLNDCTVAPLE
jgi:hypothetical protein